MIFVPANPLTGLNRLLSRPLLFLSITTNLHPRLLHSPTLHEDPLRLERPTKDLRGQPDFPLPPLVEISPPFLTLAMFLALPIGKAATLDRSAFTVEPITTPLPTVQLP